MECLHDVFGILLDAFEMLGFACWLYFEFVWIWGLVLVLIGSLQTKYQLQLTYSNSCILYTSTRTRDS